MADKKKSHQANSKSMKRPKEDMPKGESSKPMRNDADRRDDEKAGKKTSSNQSK